MRAASILQPDLPYRRTPSSPLEGRVPMLAPFCFVTLSPVELDCHHIYFGNPNRGISDENGFWVYMRHDVHMALHDRREPYAQLDADLKRMCQRRFEELGGTREEFMALIGRSYL